MRILLRILAFWLIAAPLFYWYGLPKLAKKLEDKTKQENYDSCQTQFKNYEMAQHLGQPAIDEYCTCINGALHFTREDILAMARTKTLTPELQKALEDQIDRCSDTLQGTPTPQPKANQHRLDDGSVEITL